MSFQVFAADSHIRVGPFDAIVTNRGNHTPNYFFTNVVFVFVFCIMYWTRFVASYTIHTTLALSWASRNDWSTNKIESRVLSYIRREINSVYIYNFYKSDFITFYLLNRFHCSSRHQKVSVEHSKLQWDFKIKYFKLRNTKFSGVLLLLLPFWMHINYNIIKHNLN